MCLCLTGFWNSGSSGLNFQNSAVTGCSSADRVCSPSGELLVDFWCFSSSFATSFFFKKPLWVILVYPWSPLYFIKQYTQQQVWNKLGCSGVHSTELNLLCYLLCSIKNILSTPTCPCSSLKVLLFLSKQVNISTSAVNWQWSFKNFMVLIKC